LRTISKTSQEITALPDRLMREAGLEELEKTTKEELSQADIMIRKSIAVADTSIGSIMDAA
jgi:hypothetical protein